MSRTEIIRMPTQVVQMTTQQMVVQKAMQDAQLSAHLTTQAMENAIAFHEAKILSVPEIRSAVKSGRHVIVRSDYIYETET